MHIKKSFFHYEVCHILKNAKAMIRRKIFHADGGLFLLKICVKFLGKLTRNKRVKGKESQPMYKYTFSEVLPFVFKVLKHVVISFINN